jgi:uncharacterized membrane protein YhhN
MALVPVFFGLAAVMLPRLMPVLSAQLRLPVTIYVAAIVAMGCAALTLPQPAIIIGAVAFMASDTILAVETFLLAPNSAHRRWTGITLWILYYAAQLLITLGFLIG